MGKVRKVIGQMRKAMRKWGNSEETWNKLWGGTNTVMRKCYISDNFPHFSITFLAALLPCCQCFHRTEVHWRWQKSLLKKWKSESESVTPSLFAVTYSWPSLVWPYTEELISRPFVGENRFRLVLQKRMSSENAVGCLACLSRSLFLVFHSLPCPWGAPGIFSRGFVPNWPIWICHNSNFAFLLYFL